MGSLDDISALKADIAELRVIVDTERGLSPDAHLNALAAMVHAKAVLLAVETYGGPGRGVSRDVGLLSGAVDEFRGAAIKLTAALRRLPER